MRIPIFCFGFAPYNTLNRIVRKPFWFGHICSTMSVWQKSTYISFVWSSVLMIVYDLFPLGGLFWLKLFWIAFSCMKNNFRCCCVFIRLVTKSALLLLLAVLTMLLLLLTVFESTAAFTIFGLFIFFDGVSCWSLCGDGNLKWTVGCRWCDSMLVDVDELIECREPHALFERGFA